MPNTEFSHKDNDELNLELNSELKNIISSFHSEGQNLKQEIKNDDNFRNTYKKINFHYDTSVFPKGGRDIILKMRKSEVDKNSLEGALLKNEQIQHLYATIISGHIQSRNERLQRIKKEENRSDWDIYSENESTPEKFEEFLLSEEGMQILTDEINRHLDKDGQAYDNYKVTSEILELKLRTARFDKIYREYSLEYLVDGVDEKENRMRQSINIVLNNVDDKIGDYLKMGGDKRGRGLLSNIDGLFNDEENGFSLAELQESDFNKDQLRGLLKNKIQRYAGRILKLRKRENIGQYLGNAELDLQLKSYLYIYGKFFYPEEFNKPGYELSDYESTLLEIFEAILHYDGKLEDVKNNKFLERERQAENARKERERLRIQEIAKRNRERNERAQSLRKMDKLNIGEVQTKSMDPNSATGPEIAAEANLGEQLNDYNLDVQESEASLQWKKEATFRAAWKEFIESHSDIKSLITQEQMRILFDINNNTINYSALERFVKYNPLLKDMTPEEVEEIRIKLSSFSSTFTNAENKLLENSSEMRKNVSETTRTYAIGAVIDNVRDTFNTINGGQNGDFKGFNLNIEKPAIREGNDIIISGTFNGAEVKVRYDLNTGKLFMNSFLNRLTPEKVSIGESSSVDYPIGTIRPFNDVLNDYYKLPPRSTKNTAIQSGSQSGGRLGINITSHQLHLHNSNEQGNTPQSDDLPNSRPIHRPVISSHIPKIDRSDIDSRRSEVQELLNSQINLIGDTIKNNTESQAQKNSAISKFMKTFNVISDNGQFSSWDFNKGSNLYDLIDIIEKTGDPEKGDIQALEYFNNTFMPTVIDYSGLNWGTRNEHQDKNNKKSEKIFNYNGDNKNIQCLRDNTKDFNPSQFSGIANFESSHQLGFADLVKEKLITGNELNRKLDISKMESFIKDIETVDKEVDKDADKKLEEQLANIN